VDRPPDFRIRLARGRVLLDAAMGTALHARGLSRTELPERWNRERPGDVRDVHRAHLDAGAEVVQTNTFGGNRLVLAAHGLAALVEETNAAAARLARAAADAAAAAHGAPRWVAGTLGPSRRRLPPAGDADPGEIEAAFAEQAAILVANGADLIAVETMTDRREAECALRGARRATEVPVTVCFTFVRGPGAFATPAGDDAADAAGRLADLGADAVGMNCGDGSADVAAIVSVLRAASGRGVIAKPNAGLPVDANGRAVYRQDPEEFARDGMRAVERGAAAVGGCCGTDERFVTALRRALAALPPAP